MSLEAQDSVPMHSADSLRILDANLNRAREALRVMEDAARFILNDADLSTALKDARHELRAIAEHSGIDATALTAWRDTPGDVGTPITTETERTRSTAGDVIVAAGKRAGEALRVIEEFSKIGASDADAPAAAKRLRYRVYELEKQLTLAFGAGRARQWRLCILITEALCAHASWERVADAALRAGADCLQLREKTLDDAELIRRARRLVGIARPHNAAVIVNDRADVAILVGADGVHVGQHDLSVADVRKLAGSRLLVGVSTANMDQARRAARDGADYCGCGPIFETSTKHKPVLSGPPYLREYLADPQTSRLPHLAIAGITAQNAGQLAAIGCRGVAVSGAVCSARDPGAACREILMALQSPITPAAAGSDRRSAADRPHPQTTR